MKKNEVTVEELMEQMAKSTFEKNQFFMGNRSNYTWKEREVYDALEPVLASQTDITKHPRDWFIICNRIASDFRESGRGLFHDVCQFYLDYTEKECDELYDKCLKKTYNYSRSKFFEILKSYGF